MGNKLFVIKHFSTDSYLCFDPKRQERHYLSKMIDRNTLRFIVKIDSINYLNSIHRNEPNINIELSELTFIEIDPILFAIKSETPLEPIEMKNENLLDFDQDDMPAPVKPKQKRNIIVSFDHHFWTPLKMSFKPMHYLLMTFAALAILTGYNSELLFILIIICSTIACIFLLNAVIHFITFRSIDNYLFGLMNYLIKIQVNATKRRK